MPNKLGRPRNSDRPSVAETVAGYEHCQKTGKSFPKWCRKHGMSPWTGYADLRAAGVTSPSHKRLTATEREVAVLALRVFLEAAEGDELIHVDAAKELLAKLD